MKITTSSDCSIIIGNATRSHADYWELIQNQEDEIMNGKEPKEFKELADQGLAWQNNRNFGVGRSQTEQAVTDATTDILKSISLMELEFNSFNEKDYKSGNKVLAFLLDPFLKDLIGEIICGCFEEVLLEADSLKTFITKIEYNSFLFGYGSVSRDIFSFLGRANHIRDIAFEDRTPVGDIKTWVSFDVVKASVLIKKLEDTEELKVAVVRDGYNIYENGWSKEALVDALKTQLNAKKIKGDDGKEMVFSSWDNIKTLISSRGYCFVESNIDNIHIAKIFNVEDDGKLSETYIQNRSKIAVGEMQVSGGVGSVAQNIMYQKITNKNVSDIINLVKEFSVSPSDYIQDLRGAGKYIASYSLWYNIKRNSFEDKLLLSGGPVFRSTTSLINENVKLQVNGAFVVMPENVEFAPQQTKIDLQDHIQALMIDKQEHGEMTFHYRPKAELTSRPTKDEVQMVGKEVSKQSQNRLPFKLKDYSNIFTNILFDLVNGDYDDKKQKEAQDLFIDKIVEELQGFKITKEEARIILKQVRKIHINPILQDVQVIRETLAIAPNPTARKKLTKMLLLAFGFSRKDINIFINEEQYGQELEKAALENAAFFNTEEVVFTLGQDHIVHLDTHFAKIDRVFNNVKIGEDPVKGWNYITRALSNTVQHVNVLKDHPFYSHRFKDYLKIQKQFEKEAQFLADEIKKIQEQNQKSQEGQNQNQQVELPPEVKQKLLIKQTEAMEKIKRTQLLSQATQERKKQEQQFRQQLQKEQLDNNIKMQEEMADLKKQLELLKQSTKMTK